MAHTGQPTKQSRHIDIRHFALQDWVEQDLIALTIIDTSQNATDILTKAVAQIVFNRHCNVLCGHHPPSYRSPDIT